MKEYSKGIYVKFKPEEVDILHNRMQEAGVQNMSACNLFRQGFIIYKKWMGGRNRKSIYLLFRNKYL